MEKQLDVRAQRQGVYFSANDQVLPWAAAFLESFRASNPDLPLRLVPFGEQVQALAGWAGHYGFEVHEDSEGYSALEGLGVRYEVGHTPYGKFWFRRYAAFWGPFERFWYLDVRQLVLADLASHLAWLEDLDLVHYDTAINQVYEPGPHREALLKDRRGRGFNSGRWMGRRGAFDLEDFLRLGGESLKIRDQLNPRNSDQAFINYCCDHKPLRTAHLAELDAENASNCWSRSHREVYHDGKDWRVWDHGGLDHRKKLILLHWAGIAASQVMPHRALFRRFRDAGAPMSIKLARRLLDAVAASPFRFAADLRRNRLINSVYHHLRST